MQGMFLYIYVAQIIIYCGAVGQGGGGMEGGRRRGNFEANTLIPRTPTTPRTIALPNSQPCHNDSPQMSSYTSLSISPSSLGNVNTIDLSSLDELVTAESLEKGSSEGRADGEAEALKTGLNMGIMKGWEIGVEMGFMVGVAREVIKNIHGWDIEDRTKERVRKLCGRIVRDGEGFEVVAKGEVDRARVSHHHDGGEEGEVDELSEDDGKDGGMGVMDVLQGARARFKVVRKVRVGMGRTQL